MLKNALKGLVEFARANKEQIIKKGLAVAGTLVGAVLIGVAVKSGTSSDDAPVAEVDVVETPVITE